MGTKNKKKFIYSNSYNFIAIILLSSILTVQGAQDDISSSLSPNSVKKCGPTDRLCVSPKTPHHSLVGTPRKEKDQKQSDSIVKFITWLFGTPSKPTSMVSANSTSGTHKNDTEVIGISNTTSKTVVYSVPVVENGSDVSRKGRTREPQEDHISDDQNEEADNGNVRSRRDSYKPIKVPYTKSNSGNNNPVLNDAFSRRQLLLNPIEQQQAMIAIQAQQQQQQQVAAAAAAMLQQQQILNGNRYATLLDDYDDRDHEDDDSDEDSDEFDDIPKFAPPPLIEHHHMYFRRGVDDDPAVPIEGRQRREDGSQNAPRNKKGSRNRVAAMKSGHWLLDDYDLHSEFYDRPQERGNLPQNYKENGRQTDRIELDEVEHYNRHQGMNDNIEEPLQYRFRDSLSRQDSEGDTSSTSEAAEPDSSSTEGTPTDSDSSSTEGSSSASPVDGASSSGSPVDMSTMSPLNSTMGLGNGTDISSTTLANPGIDSTTPGSDLNSTMTEGSESNSTEASTTGSSSMSSTTAKPNNPPPPYKATLNCKCGTQSVRGAGIGDGTVVRFHVNPWLMEITSTEVKGKHLCSGSLINDRYVLTSKSCVSNATSPGSLRVVSGLQSKQSKSYQVKSIITNPKANIALLQLNSAIKPSSTVRPICLPIGKRYAGPYSSGNLVTFKKTNDKTPIQMVDTEVAIYNNDTSCSTKGEGTVCAGPPGSAKCGGDTVPHYDAFGQEGKRYLVTLTFIDYFAGGVLMVYRGGYSYEQIGVVADTVGCRPKNMSGVYTDIRKRTRWILNKSSDGNYCKNPKVTPEDLSSSTRFGDAAYQINVDEEDSSEEIDHRKEDYGSEEFGDVNNEEEEADDVSNENLNK